jgi:hypothetical protein
VATVLAYVRGILGGAVGGVAGYYAFHWLIGMAQYSVMLPGVLFGLGCGLLSGKRSLGLATLSLFAGLALGVYTEWSWAPFAADDSFGYFLSHLMDLKLNTKIMVVLGGVVGFWLGWGTNRGSFRTATDEAEEE